MGVDKSCMRCRWQILAAGANAVAAVRSPKTSHDLQDLKQKYPEALTIVALDSGVFSSVKVCILLSVVQAEARAQCSWLSWLLGLGALGCVPLLLRQAVHLISKTHVCSALRRPTSPKALPAKKLPRSWHLN